MKHELALQQIVYPVKYSDWGTNIFDADNNHIADVRGWGWIKYLKNPEKTQDGIGEFIAEAINEKIEREKNIKQHPYDQPNPHESDMWPETKIQTYNGPFPKTTIPNGSLNKMMKRGSTANGDLVKGGK